MNTCFYQKTVNIMLKHIYTDKEITTTLTKRSLKKLISGTCQKKAFSFNDKMYKQMVLVWKDH